MLLGAATTVAVAWALALRVGWEILAWGGDRFAERARDPLRGEGVGTVGLLWVLRPGTTTLVGGCRHETEPSSEALVPRKPGAPEDFVPWALRRYALPWVTGDAPWPGPDRPDGDYRYIVARGWPFRALWSRVGWFNSLAEESPEPPVLGGIHLDQNVNRWVWVNIMPMDQTMLPYYPVIPGFAADTALYAGLWWALLFGPGATRRLRRRRRGLCPRCAYDLKGLPSDSPCPECGGQR